VWLETCLIFTKEQEGTNMNVVEMPPITARKKSLDEYQGIAITVHLRESKDSLLAGTLVQIDETGAWVSRSDTICFVPFSAVAYIALPDGKKSRF
jgi:hypothetical protein